MAKKLVVFGASNPSVIKILHAVNRDSPVWNLQGFVDDTLGEGGGEFFGHPIMGTREVILTLDRESTFFFNNVFGSMPARRQVTDVLEGFGCALVSLLSPDVDTTFSRIGTGVAIEENVTLDVGVSIGDHSCVKRSASIGHESAVDDFAFIGPGATVCGRVKVGEGVYIGAGSVVRDRIAIGAGSTVGVGAVVVKDVPPNVVVVGNPAKVLNP